MCGRISQARDLMDYYDSIGLPPETFTWYKVTRDVNKAGNQSPQMVEPIADPN